MITFDPVAFVAAFPEFGNATTYPLAMLTFWGSVAEAQVNCDRWGSQTQTGQFLYVAHEITLAAKNVQVAALGGTPGAQSGPMNSKTVGSVTAAYDTQQTAEKDAGYWNLTTYGKQLIRLARLYGSGVIQL